MRRSLLNPMPVWLDTDTPLPLGRQAAGPESDWPGLVALGGVLSNERLEEAYRKGIFPWYSPGDPVAWWSPDPRMVLPVDRFRLTHNFRKTLRRFRRTPGCRLRFDGDFAAVIGACASTPREGQPGTWIVPEVQAAYTAWHRAGFAHSVETWIDGQLVGGLYFVNIGRMVFGESMFSHRSDGSKIALAGLVAACRGRGVSLIDCQQNTRHLASLGGHEIPRADFEAHLALTLGADPVRPWSYDEGDWDLLLPPSDSPDAADPTAPADPTAAA